MKKRIYITRDTKGKYVDFWVGKPNPLKNQLEKNSFNWYGVNKTTNHIGTINAKDFKKLTGIKLNGGKKSIIKIEGIKLKIKK